MKRLHSGLIHGIQRLFIIVLILSALVVMALWLSHPTAYALPEYATRTGESCATCHVSPGGGGPRTLRGLLWAARGRPDLVPTLPSTLMAPGVKEGLELYDIACAACHGLQAEGLFAMGLAGMGVGRPSVRSFIQRGIPLLGMPAFQGQFTDDQLDALVTYVAGLTSGEIPPPPNVYPLPPAQFTCQPDAGSSLASCTRLPISSRGN